MRHDAIIIGAGPIGLETAAALQALGLSATVVDAGCVGETISRQFPTNTTFFSSPERLEIAGIRMPLDAQEKPTGEHYLAYLRSVVDTLDLQVRTFERVTAANRVGDHWQVTITCPNGIERRIEATHVVLASGGTQHSRTLGIPGEELAHVHSYLGDPHRFFRRRLLVVGGKNSAAESALRCWRLGARVALACRGAALHERVKPWLRPEVTALLDEGRITPFMQHVVERIEPGTVHLRNTTDDTCTTWAADDVLLQLGFKADPALLDLFGVPHGGEHDAPVFDARTMATPIAGVYVAGTVTAGTQRRFRVYIETSHVHAARIAAALTGAPPPDTPAPRALPEN